MQGANRRTYARAPGSTCGHAARRVTGPQLGLTPPSARRLLPLARFKVHGGEHDSDEEPLWELESSLSSISDEEGAAKRHATHAQQQQPESSTDAAPAPASATPPAAPAGSDASNIPGGVHQVQSASTDAGAHEEQAAHERALSSSQHPPGSDSDHSTGTRPDAQPLHPADAAVLAERIKQIRAHAVAGDPYRLVREGTPGLTLADVRAIMEAGKRRQAQLQRGRGSTTLTQRHPLNAGSGSAEDEQGSQHGGAEAAQPSPRFRRRFDESSVFGQNEGMWPWWRPSFTRQREVIAGRAAMVGLALAALQEIWLPGHPGILQQVAGMVPGGISLPAAAALLWVIAVSNTAVALLPWSFTWSEQNKQDVARRPPGPPRAPMPPPDEMAEMPPSNAPWARRLAYCLGLGTGSRGWGFTRANELLMGRTAMLAFVLSLRNEVASLPHPAGPLAQLASWLHVEANDGWYMGTARVLSSVAVLGVLVAYAWGSPGSGPDDEREVH